MTSPQATVVVPFHNRERFLPETIRSILGQSYRRVELLLVDDGSTDRSFSIAQSFSDPRVRRIRLPKRRGKPQALNRVFPLIRGEWVCFFDSDDLMTPRSLELRVRFLRGNPRALAVMGRIGRIIDGQGRPLPARHWMCRYQENAVRMAGRLAGSEGGLLPELFAFGRPPLSPLSATLFRRTTLREAGPFLDMPIGEDREYLLRVSSRRPLPFLDRPVMWYRVHSGNLSFRLVRGLPYYRGTARSREELRKSYRRLF